MLKNFRCLDEFTEDKAWRNRLDLDFLVSKLARVILFLSFVIDDSATNATQIVFFS